MDILDDSFFPGPTLVWSIYRRRATRILAASWSLNQDPVFPAPPDRSKTFTFDEIPEDMQEFNFRYVLHDLYVLAQGLGLHATEYRLENRSVVNHDTLLGIYLDYLSYPKRFGDLQEKYHRDPSPLCRALKEAFTLI